MSPEQEPWSHSVGREGWTGDVCPGVRGVQPKDEQESGEYHTFWFGFDV